MNFNITGSNLRHRHNTFWNIGAVCLKRHPTHDLPSSCHDMLGYGRIFVLGK